MIPHLRVLPRAALPTLVLLCRVAAAQTLSGSFFHDLDGDGQRDAGEPRLDGVGVTVYGAGSETSTSSMAGGFTVATTAGCHGVDVEPPPDWRVSLPDQSECPAGARPVGTLRYGAPQRLRENLADGSFLYISLGDSIAAGVSVCIFDDTDYVEDVAANLGCLAPGVVTVDNRAEGGRHSEDLLTPRNGGNAYPQFIPNVVAANPDLVTISIGGNDFLNTEPGAAGQDRPFDAADLAASFQELIATRQTVQEVLSVLVSELPDADVAINTVYDNLAYACDTTDFHAAAPAMWNQMLRNLAWGQVQPVVVAEVEKEIAHQDVTRASCCGAQDMICAFDQIHPNRDGAPIIEEAVMESLGRVEVAPTGDTGGYDIGLVNLVATLSPSSARSLGGSVTAPEAALELDGAGAVVGVGGSMEVTGFVLPPDVTPLRVVVGVRYRTTGNFVDDRHRFAASVLDFAAPVLDFTGWDTSTPIVGGSGTRGNIGSLSVVNALPNVPDWRDASALLTLNAIDDGTVTGRFSWPLPTSVDIGRLAVRLTTQAVGVSDAGSVEWDGAWAWVYGTRGAAPVPGEVSGRGSATPLRVRFEGAGVRLDWGAEPDSAVYRVYRGLLGNWDGAVADPSIPAGGCSTSTTFLDVLPPDDSASCFYLVSGVSAQGAEGPLGYRNDDPADVPRTAARATCP